ncbi:hypothetical protein [Curtobacterium sp. TXMA1]|uniref:hypothetical protein n=1 Tax=Curtobacterium sp. TXMA1 TaxID=2876939 RepID=UPI001CCD72AA|nr:hypothetical protein [Curtobacterium sp. TXMA1]UBQ02766.1 hypothetical protein LCG91_00925 [Curtobacterium sp. TXMA1]
MGKIDWRSLLRLRGRRGTEPRESIEPPDHHLGTELIIRAARHVVTTRVATTASVARHLHVSPVVADRLLARLEHCEVVGPSQAGERRPVLPTSGQLPGIIEEFRRRG